MKLVMIVYNEALDNEVMETLEKCALKNWTKIPETFGRGSSSGTHLSSDVWPGRNNVLYSACEEKEAKCLIACIRELRTTLGSEGIKAFVLPVEEVT